MAEKRTGTEQKLNLGKELYYKGKEKNKTLIAWAEKEISEKLEKYFEEKFPEPLFSNGFVSEVYRLQLGEKFKNEFMKTFPGARADEVKKLIHSVLGYALYLMLEEIARPYKVKTDESGYIIYDFA